MRCPGKTGPIYGLSVPPGQVVQHNRLIAVACQVFAHVGADVSGATSYEDAHSDTQLKVERR